ncbi:VIT1/CCC1 transporter family protein [Ornithinimicrobium sufpigmenti]|uniref:VIT1/CCC1 transporter family protein n=1 Tax=Ornithinimicrobium sufpigmenti TaxID=2508882 RepID=UPI001035FA2F|nr:MULTISPECIES: VIT1/CCC1 family protein [unclassified Ornithinimicrobium]
MTTSHPSTDDVRRWRRHLADERANSRVFRDLAARRHGEERDILNALAEAEERHAQHWATLLGNQAEPTPRATLGHRVHAWLARRFGMLFVLSLLQRSKAGNPYARDADASSSMVADEAVHEEVLRALAARGRLHLSGTFRAAVFGANDGLVSNLALVMGMAAAVDDSSIVLTAGMAGLLAGALSMAAGEYISVRSARELLAASQPSRGTSAALGGLDLNTNELELVYRARGMDPDHARARAADVLGQIQLRGLPPADAVPAVVSDADEQDAVLNPWGAALASFGFFASGALVPVLPYLIGFSGYGALLTSLLLVGVALLVTGGVVGVLSGASPLARGLRQLLIGYGAAAATYLLGLAFGASGLG